MRSHGVRTATFVKRVAMSHLLFRRIPMASLSWERPQDFRKREEVYLSLDPVGNFSTASFNITTLRDGILYSLTLPPVGPLTTLPLPSERWNAVDLGWLASYLDRNRFWLWATPPLKLSLTQVRALRLSEWVRHERAPLLQGQRLSLHSTLRSASATEMPFLRWSTTWESLCDKCNHGIPLSTL